MDMSFKVALQKVFATEEGILKSWVYGAMSGC